MRKFKANIVSTDGSVLNLTDKERFPAPELLSIEDIFDLKNLNDTFRKENFSHYEFNGFAVPRVSDILAFCGNKDGIVKWAASIDTKEYYTIKNRALRVGSAAHEAIENYITGTYPKNVCVEILSTNSGKQLHGKGEIQQAITCFKNFIAWERNLNHYGMEIERVLGVETELVTPYFGGTFDLVLQVNGSIYLVDLKSSKRISYEYCIQTAAYYWAIINGYCPTIPYVNGTGIIRLDKYEEGKFNDLFFNTHIPYQYQSLQYYINAFIAYLNAFYHGKNAELEFIKDKKEYKHNYTLRGE